MKLAYHQVSSDHTAPSGITTPVIEVGRNLDCTLGRGGLGYWDGDVEERVHIDRGGAS